MTKLHDLAILGQSIWLDFIRRSFIDSGELNALVDMGLRGVTSNPAIFHKAITGGTDYDAAIERLVAEGMAVLDIYETLAVQDIRRAADVLLPVYEKTAGLDGYVSLEVNPHLAHDTEGTVMEARRLFSLVDRPNVMIKVPATPAGIPAIETLIGEGINVNVTLIFSMEHYEQAARAYIAGLERLAATNVDPSRVASVASVFVSRVDTAVDRLLDEMGHAELQGKIAIANAKTIYARFRELFRGPRWERLAAQGARLQRVLWGSTSTKNPNYPDTLYVDHLIGPDTVNTLPLDTLRAFLDHGRVARTVDVGLEEARAQLVELRRLGIDLDAITEQLQEEGVKAFADAFDALLQSLARRVQAVAGSSGQALREHIALRLGEYEALVQDTLAHMEDQRTVPRIWAGSYSVWSDSPHEIVNRLGWLRIAEKMQGERGCIEAFVHDVQKAGYTHAVVLGMGGSSLAPEVFAKVFQGTGMELAVLDSTHPTAVRSLADALDLAHTLFLVSTKSGTTVETLSFFKYFYTRAVDALGPEEAGAHFVAVTDPGTPLVTLAEAYGFRTTFLADPTIGGRYSALSHFGLVPAALTGVDLRRLLRRALEAMDNCGAHVVPAQNPGALLGAVLGSLAQAGRNKLTVLASPGIEPFGDWLEQLVAESTGKSGKGIVPVVGEAPGQPGVYGPDRLFVYLKLDQDTTHDALVEALTEAGHPVVVVQFRDRYDLGAQFFVWEFAVAVAGALLGIHPFNQPNVEATKVQTRHMLETFRRTGQLPALEPTLVDGPIRVVGEIQATSAQEALLAFLERGRPGDYIGLQAYLPPTQGHQALLRELQAALRDRTTLATTLGFGPRFLHSTGQLHKGDSGRGLFVQFVDVPQDDVPIPDEAGKPGASTTFGVLLQAQALGDRQALLEAGRRVLRLELGEDPGAALQTLLRALAPVPHG